MAKQKPWTDRWKIQKPLSGGGQCENYLVQAIDGNPAGDFVLKVIKDSTKFERRSRFYREVHNYIALNNPQIPKIVDHNCDETPEFEKRLYFVYPYMAGDTLEERIIQNGPLSLSNAFNILSQLAAILASCHTEGIVHRDIKPDNIIIGADDGIPRLIDFGLSAKDSDEILKESGQMQLGNRFLYLPELKENNGNKRDKRSDITYLVGLLYFMLTGLFPTHFVDEDGKYPHQRINFDDILKEIPLLKMNLLKSLFDKGFQVQLNKRIQSIEELTELMNKIMATDEGQGKDYMLLLSSMNNDSKATVEQELAEIYPKIKYYFDEIPKRNKFQHIEIGVSGPVILSHWDPICIAGHYYLTEKYERKLKQTYEFKVYPNGFEYILAIIIGTDQHVIQRFQDITELTEDTVAQMEQVIWRSFAEIVKKEST